MPTLTTRVLSLISPMTQLNTPYPSTAYLTGFLRSRGIEAQQSDVALNLVLKLFSSAGLKDIRIASENKKTKHQSVTHFLEHFEKYSSTIDQTISFLQGRDSTLAHRINTRTFLPEGARFDSLNVYVGEEGGSDPLAWAFGSLGAQDKARHLATLYLNDLSDVVRHGIDSHFEFVRYAESLAASQSSFSPLASALSAPLNLVDSTAVSLALEAVEQHQPTMVLISVPFPGSVYAAFRMAQAIKAKHADIKLVLGGGYVNTELRELAEPRVFEFFDFVTVDAGERPLLSLIDYLEGKRPKQQLVRTFVCEDKVKVNYIHFNEPDVPFAEVGTPTWVGLPIDKYLSLLDMLNPMHRLWSDGRWNKLTVAHGCYWKKCSFCDVSLDYISRYETATASELVNRIESIVKETGQTGFHFVDEAAPPKALKALAQEIKNRNVSISWWGNIRFEKTFDAKLCEELAASGCIAISGGLEVASDRLLKLMQKGVSVEQVARVTKSFTNAGILVHAYLMYGFPTQTVQDTVDSLEYVRQLFANDCIQSGYFHRFTCTVHSPVGKNPQDFGVTLVNRNVGTFANNDVSFIDPTGVDHDSLGVSLNKALYNFMHGIGLDQNVKNWFGPKVPKTTVRPDFIERALRES
jgi:tRNA A37 methylthiotransferase MiaB